MSNDIPIAKKIAWLPVALHVLFQVILIWVLWRVWFSDNLALALFCGAGGYLAYSKLSKAIVLRHHYQGMKLLKAERYREALAEFQASYKFFSNNGWLDRGRYVFLLSENAIPFRAAELCNIAYAYWMLNDIASSRNYYQKALDAYPGYDVLKEALEFVESAKHGKVI